MSSNILSVGLVGFAASLLTGLIILITQRWHGRWTFDQVTGVQKFHQSNVPRIGGLTILAGLCAIELLYSKNLGNSFKFLLVASLIPFFFGLAEDLTKRVSVGFRLLATAAGAAVFIFLAGTYLTHLDLPGLDFLMSFATVAMIATVFMVSGMTNAINIIDGFHGLASGTVILIFMALGFLAHGTQDSELLHLCVLLTCVTFGFFVLNYPLGKIFLGDGGAYFLGFMVAEIAILLPVRNPEISPWVSLLICAYPVVEVLYSMVRRTLEKRSSGSPDDQHLHTLIKMQLIRPSLPTWTLQQRNILVAPICWLMTVLLSLWAIIWQDTLWILVLGMVVFVLCYHVSYRYLAKRSIGRNGN